MNIQLFNPYVLKIIITAREEDSIIAIARRIKLSYGWAHKWVGELIKEGVFKEKWRGLILQKNNSFYKEILNFIKKNLNNVQFYYSALQLFGIEYSFTGTDAVYIWTEGRYNISRYRDFYPIFIKIKEADYKLFLDYCNKLDLKVNCNKGIFYSPEIVKEIKTTNKGTMSVDALEDTILFMKRNVYNFQPALEMINEMYKKNLNVNYKEINNL